MTGCTIGTFMQDHHQPAQHACLLVLVQHGGPHTPTSQHINAQLQLSWLLCSKCRLALAAVVYDYWSLCARSLMQIDSCCNVHTMTESVTMTMLCNTIHAVSTACCLCLHFIVTVRFVVATRSQRVPLSIATIQIRTWRAALCIAPWR